VDKKGIIRRSVSLPETLDEHIGIMAREFSYKVKNELIIELLELGILKFKENIELKNKIDILLNKMDLILNSK